MWYISDLIKLYYPISIYIYRLYYGRLWLVIAFLQFIWYKKIITIKYFRNSISIVRHRLTHSKKSMQSFFYASCSSYFLIIFNMIKVNYLGTFLMDNHNKFYYINIIKFQMCASASKCKYNMFLRI